MFRSIIPFALMLVFGCSCESIPDRSLTTDVLPKFQAHCGVCHTRTSSPSPDAVAGGFYLETKADILNLQTIGMVVPGKGATSQITKITRRTMLVSGDPMPPGSPYASPWTSDECDVLQQWIDQGALDN